MWIEKNNNPWNFDTKRLLDELLSDISKVYWIDIKSAEKLVQSKSIHNLNSLKSELENISKWWNNEKLNSSKLEKLFFTIAWAKEVIEKASRDELNIIKEELENLANFEEFENSLEDYLPADIIKNAKNPKSLHHHILWASLWVSNSIIKTADILYQIGKWILKTPYDLYLIISWKWEYNWLKNI
jgi:hypothetical protein